MTDDYGMFSNLVPSVEEKEDDYGMFADLVPSVDTKAKAKDYGMFSDLVPSVETAVTPQLEAQSQAFKPIKVTPAKQGWGELGGWQNSEDGSVSTELTITVNHPELNNGMPTVIPTLVAGQDDLDGLLNFNITEQHEEVAVKRAIDRQKDGMTWPSFINMDLANEFAEERSSNKTDNAFEFSADQAQKMFGRGAQVWAELSESEPISQWAKEYVAKQDMEIAEGGYKSSYDRNSLRETFNEDGFGTALGYVGESIAENSVSSGVALASTGVAAVAVALSAPAWVPLSIGALTIAGSGTLGTGEAALEMEDKGVDVSNKKAAGVGILIGLLEKVGAGKVIPVGQLAEMSGDAIIKQLISEGSIQAAKEFAKVFSKKVGSEVGTEIAQESAIMGAAASEGAEYDPLEVFDRLVDTAFISAGMSGPVAAASTVTDVKQANSLAQSIDSTLSDFNNDGGTNNDGSGNASASGTPEIQDTTDAIIREADGSITSVVIPTPRSEPAIPDAPTSEAPDIATVEVDINAQRADLDDDLAAALTAVQAEPSTTVPAPFGDAVAPQVQPESLESMTNGLPQLEADALSITADDMAQLDLDDSENQVQIDQEIAAFNASTAAIPTELAPVAAELAPVAAELAPELPVAPVKKKLVPLSQRPENAAQPKKVDPKLVDPTKDDLLTAVAKIGGVRRGEASAEGFDPADFGMRKAGLNPVFRAKPDQGVSFDSARETLAQDGYIDSNTTVNEFVNLLQKAVRGETVVSNRNENYIAQQDAERLDDYTQQGGVVPEAPTLQAPVVSQDQTLTSALEEARNDGLPESEIDSILTNYPKESEAVLQLQMSMSGVELGDSSGSNQAARVGDIRSERTVQQGEGDRGLAGSSTDVATGSSDNESQNVTDEMGVLLSPSATSGNPIADSEAGSGGGINNAGLSGAVDAGSSSLRPKSLRNRVSVDRTGEKERKRITERFAKKSGKGRKDLLRQAGLMLTGDANTQGNRLVDALEGAELMATYDTLEAFTEAVSAGEISQEDVYRYANAAKRGGQLNNLTQFSSNANTIYSWATANNDLDIPLRSPASQKIYDDQVAQAEIDGEDRRVADKDKRNTVTKFLRENRSDVESYWENSSPAERTELLNQVSASSAFGKYTPKQISLNINKDKIEDLPNNTMQNLVRWMPDNWANFRDANNGVNTTTASDPVADTTKTPVSTAPEQTEESFGLEAQTEETLAADTDQRKTAATEQAAKEKTENDKIQADKEVGEFMLTGSDAPVDVAMGFGQEGLFDNQPEATSVEEDAKVDAYVEANAETKSDSTDGDMSQGDVLFSKSAILGPNDKPKGVTEAQIQARVDAFLAKYKGADNVRVWIRDTQDNAFGPGSTAKDGPIKAGYYPKQDAVVFIAENIDSLQDIDATIQHELLVHKGLGLFEESDVKGLIEVIKENAAKSKTLKDAWAEVQRKYKKETLEVQAEELLAKVAETKMSKPDKYWNKIVTYIRDMLRKLGFVKEISFSDLRKRVYDMGEAFAEGRRADRRQGFEAKTNETKSPSSDGLSASGMLKSKGDGQKPPTVVLKGRKSPSKPSDVNLQGANATSPSGGMRPGAPLLEGSKRPNAKVKNEKGTGKPDVTIYGVDADGKRLLTAKPRAGGWDIIIEKKPNGEMFPNGKPLEVTAKNVKQVEQRIKMLGLEVENITNKDGPTELSVLDENHFEMPDATNFEWWRFNLQDKFINLKRAQDAIEKYTGEILPEEMNAYVKETLSHGKAEAQISLFHEETLKPVIKYMGKNELSLEDVSQYLYARHAEEANAFQEKQNAQRVENEALSGMSNEEAAEIMADFESRGKVQALVNIAKLTDGVIKKTRKIMVKSGLQSQTVIDEWANQFDYYTPLWGDPQDPDGKNMGGAEVKKRVGRGSKADNVFVNLIVQHEKTIIAAEKNAVKRSLLRLAERNPNPNLWSINKREYVKAIDPVTGLVVDVIDNQLELGNHIVRTRVDGVDTVIELNKENVHAANMALAFNGKKDKDLIKPIKIALMANRYFSMINTTWNPEFVLPNLARDLQTAVVNLNDTDARDVRVKILKNTWSSYRAIRKHQKGDRTSEETQWYDEFYKAGAQTGWIENYDSMKSRAAKIQSMIARDKHLSLDTAHRMVELVSDVNTGVENAVRLSTYIELRKLGKSQDEAANIAKNLTVNFNRKGNQGPTANALYLFFNAAMQGTVRLAEAMTHKHVRRAVYKLVAFSALLDILNRLIGGEDEYEESAYDKIPDYVKRSNMIFMIPSSSDETFGRGYIKIPMPYGYNVFQVIGSTLGETTSYMLGGKPELSAAKQLERVRDSFIHAFNPVGSDASFMQFILPTMADPAIQIVENKNFSGSKIRPDQNPYTPDLPRSELYWESVPEPLKIITRSLNTIGGGDQVRSGPIDVSPEDVQHIYQFATGGAGRFFYDLISTPVDAVFNPEELDVRDIPFLRRLYGKVDDRVDRDRFYKVINEIKTVQSDLKITIENEDIVREGFINEKYGYLLDLHDGAKATMQDLRGLKQDIELIEATDLNNKEKSEAIMGVEKEIRTKMKSYYQEFKAAEKAAKKAAEKAAK